MPNANYLDLKQLPLFTELLVRNYLPIAEGPAYTSNAISAALQQYRNDAVQIHSSFKALPVVGKAGVIYLVHKSRTDINYTPTNREIWIDAPEFRTMRARFNDSASGPYFPLTKNDAGYYVLNLDDIRDVSISRFRLLEENDTTTGDYSASNSMEIGKGCTYNLYRDQILAGSDSYNLIDSRTEVEELAGHIISVLKSQQQHYTIMPVPEYISGTGTTASTPADEIWIYVSAAWEEANVCFGTGNSLTKIPLTKNAFGYYVLSFTDIPANPGGMWLCSGTYTSTSVTSHNRQCTNFLLYFDNEINYSRAIENNLVTEKLGGQIIAVSPGSMITGFVSHSSAYTNTDIHEFVTYAYENGKYVQLGSAQFKPADYVIDHKLGYSTNTITNKAVTEAINNKYDVANITGDFTVDGEDIVTSDAIYRALLPKMNWKDCVPISLLDMMKLLRFPFNMPTEMYFRLDLYAPLHEQDLAIYTPKETQSLGVSLYGYYGFVLDFGKSTQANLSTGTNPSSSSSYNYGTGYSSRYMYDPELQKSVNIIGYAYGVGETSSNSCGVDRDYLMYSSHSSGYSTSVTTGKDFHIHFESAAPLSMVTLGRLTYRLKAYNSNESTKHNHINKLYVTVYISPNGQSWSPVQRNLIYNYDDNYAELHDYIYLIPILA
jgi:hypothetical protein